MNKGLSIAIGFGELIGALVTLSVVILIFGFLTGDIVKFKNEKEVYEEVGKAINILNVIATSSDLVVKDTNNQPEKAVISKEKLIEIRDSKKELDCCSYIEYDYSLQVKNLKTEESFDIGFPAVSIKNFFEQGKKCKQIPGEKFLRTYSIPVVIADGNNERYPAEMKINLVKTPLSNIANNLAIACSKNKYSNDISIYELMQTSDGIKIEKISSTNNYKICILSSDGTELCKVISCGFNIQEVNKRIDEISTERWPIGCFPAKIENDGTRVILNVPDGF